MTAVTRSTAGCIGEDDMKRDCELIRAMLQILEDEPTGRGFFDAVNTSGEAFLSHTKINGRYAIRLAIGNISSDQADVDRAWELLRYEASRLHDKMRRERFSAAGKS